jgi:Cys/Met metabolism PLP-dependent enzyme
MAPTGKLQLHDLPTPDPESPFRPRKQYRFSTLCATVENPDMKDQYGSSAVPIYQTATFKGVDGEYDYSRSGNPTRSHLGMITSPGWVVNTHEINLQNIMLPKFHLLLMHSSYPLEWQL